MRVNLTGLNKATKRLKDGTTRIYWYAWRGGPLLSGDPGSPEFMSAYAKAWADRPAARAQAATLRGLTLAYTASADFATLAPRTQIDYGKLIVKINAEFGDFPIGALQDKRARGDFLEWRDRLAKSSLRQADYLFSAFARILSWALSRGKTDANPLEKIGRLYEADRKERVWSLDDEAAFIANAPARIRLALMLATWTGQRQGDLLALAWTNYDGERIRLRQGKSRVRVMIPVGAPLKAALDAEKRLGALILLTEDGTRFTGSGFRTAWRRATAKAGLEGLTFHDLRGTAVTRLALSGATEAEIATITGHSLRDVKSILDTHYLSRDFGLAESGIRKLEKTFREHNSQTASQTGSSGQHKET